jgi:hypothetical protein
MERVADEVGSSLILLGCDSANASRVSSGLAAPVWDLEVAQSLTRALRADDYGGFLSSLGTEVAPFLARTNTVLGHRRMLQAERQGDIREMRRLMTVTTGLSVGGRPPAVVSELRSRIIPFVPVAVQVAYFIGVIGAAILFRSLWREWMTLWPLQGSAKGWRHHFLVMLRYSGFAVIGPSVGLLVIAMIPVVFLMFFLPFIPWSLPFRLLGGVETVPFVIARQLKQALSLAFGAAR